MFEKITLNFSDENIDNVVILLKINDLINDYHFEKHADEMRDDLQIVYDKYKEVLFISLQKERLLKRKKGKSVLATIDEDEPDIIETSITEIINEEKSQPVVVKSKRTVADIDTSNLEALTCDDLRLLCKDKNLSGYSKLKKEHLITKLKAFF